MGVWRCVQASVLCADFGLLGSILLALAKQGRLWQMDGWSGAEWSNVVFGIWVGGLRFTFLVGVGIVYAKDDRSKRDC